MNTSQIVQLFLISALALSATLLFNSQNVEGTTATLDSFQSWQIKQGKSYSSDEFIYRFTVFAENLRKIETHNSTPGVSYKMAINRFADMTSEEFSSTILMKEKFNNTKTGIKAGGDNFFKGSKDFRNDGVLNVIQNQGSCGSCYTFATAAATEAAYKMQTKLPLMKFSEQQLVSCSQEYGNDGCDGGFGSGSFAYVIEKGLDLLSTYPYVSGAEGDVPPCKVAEGKYKINSYTNVVGYGHCLQIQQAAQQQPLYGRLNAENWHFYSEGIFPNTECSDDPNKINHAITIVGYNTENENMADNYWLIRNSWGTDWGLNGYIQLQFGNTCSVCHEAFYPIVTN